MNVANAAFWTFLVLTLFLGFYSFVPKYAIPRYVAYANSAGSVGWKRRLWYFAIIIFPALVAATISFVIIFSIDYRAEESTNDKVALILMLMFTGGFVGLVFDRMMKNLKDSNNVD